MHWYRLLQRHLLLRVTLPSLVACAQLVIVLIHLATGRVSAIVLLWILPALLVGYPFGRLTRISWNAESTQLVLLGGQSLLTVAYLALLVSAHVVLKHDLSQVNDVSAIVLLVAAGIALGRLFGLRHQILQALGSRASNAIGPGGH